MKEGEALTSKAKTNLLIVSLSKTWNEGRRRLIPLGDLPFPLYCPGLGHPPTFGLVYLVGLPKSSADRTGWDKEKRKEKEIEL